MALTPAFPSPCSLSPNHCFLYLVLFISSALLLHAFHCDSCHRYLHCFITFSITLSLSSPACFSAHTGEGVKFMFFALKVSHLLLTSPLFPWLIPNPGGSHCTCNKWWTCPFCLFQPKQEANCKWCGISHYDPDPNTMHSAYDIHTFLTCI